MATQERVVQIRLKDSEWVAIHVINRPEAYREILTFNSFFFNYKKQYHYSPEFLYTLDHSWRDNVPKTKKQIEWESSLNIPEVRHDSFLDFLIYIGYDRKTKRWI